MDPFDEPDEDHESYAMMTTQVTSKLQKRVPGLYIKIQLMIGVAETIDVWIQTNPTGFRSWKHELHRLLGSPTKAAVWSTCAAAMTWCLGYICSPPMVEEILMRNGWYQVPHHSPWYQRAAIPKACRPEANWKGRILITLNFRWNRDFKSKFRKRVNILDCTYVCIYIYTCIIRIIIIIQTDTAINLYKYIYICYIYIRYVYISLITSTNNTIMKNHEKSWIIPWSIMILFTSTPHLEGQRLWWQWFRGICLRPSRLLEWFI